MKAPEQELKRLAELFPAARGYGGRDRPVSLLQQNRSWASSGAYVFPGLPKSSFFLQLLRGHPAETESVWQPDETALVECRQLEQVNEQLLKQKTMIINALEALQRQPIISKLALKRLQQTLKTLTQQVEKVEAELLALLDQRFATEMTLLCSIPGIGRKTAGMLLLFAGGFTHLDNYCDGRLVAS